ncbi:26719_t:CDS:2 [Gigaspora margarita]|uniref:26719_t:CDS:1 n=1 Tax=Gigaspora margarita TaxID=4874 RepID=A0ABN7XBE0_GIGMA|nr:26719_t:CDS:2 [Gigaspora margarita]
MPTLTKLEPDSLDLNYFYAYFSTSFGITFLENELINKNIKPIPANKESTCLKTISCCFYGNKHYSNNMYILIDNEVYYIFYAPTTSSSSTTSTIPTISDAISLLDQSRKDLTSIFQDLQATTSTLANNSLITTTSLSNLLSKPSSNINTSKSFKLS